MNYYKHIITNAVLALDEPIDRDHYPENAWAEITEQEYNNIKNPPPPPTPAPQPKTTQEAVMEGNQYIFEKGFDDLTRQELTAMAAGQLLTSGQMVKYQQTLQWMLSLKQSAIIDPVNFIPSGEPPYTPTEIIS